ncbi:hypothetical protein PBI_ANDREW_69 [Arthrobacter phage Andrew]|uniref:Uncharacterized protein n=1 Tax=Arthrobacter phage Andrew TaxID=2419946 RepID=A0A3G2KD72_9CAUD|nr:hypothetical protein HOU53_gp69 [Arthrobacter phage Andrew]AYN56881.1 hypothetical protein PBI_ANDREW_69 [Arthrobacter phage Andrew]
MPVIRGAVLRLLERARQIQEQDASVSAAFRAGLRVGAAHPEVVAWLDATKEEEQDNG